MTGYRSFSPTLALQDLRGSEPMLRTLIDLFLVDCQAALERTARAQADSDSAALLRELHTLRGSFAVLRAEPARRLAGEINREIDAGAPPTRERLDELLTEAVLLAAELRAWRDGPRPVSTADGPPAA
jgi:HPt (histidine-containing phosphotransfer) domain-containing protein